MEPFSHFAVTSPSGGDVFLESRLLCLPDHLLPHSAVIAHGARSAVVREQTGYRAAVSLAREHIIIAKMHARGLRNVFAVIKEISRNGPFSPFFTLSRRASRCPTTAMESRDVGKKREMINESECHDASFSTMQSEEEGHVLIQDSRSLYCLRKLNLGFARVRR